MKKCENSRCGEWIDDRHAFCPSCRYLARWAFGLGAAIVGALSVLIKIFS